MGEPLHVGVLALDPMLGVRVGSGLCCCPEVSVVPPGEAAAVMVLAVDAVTGPVLDLLREVRGGAHRPAVVLVATEPTVVQVMDAIAAGAGGVLRRREVEPARLARAVLAAAGGDCAVPPDVLAELSEQGADRTVQRAGLTVTGAAAPTVPGTAPTAPTGPGDVPGSGPGSLPGAGLSEREQAVLTLIAEGHETDEIARELCCSPRTVAGVVHDVTRRLRLRNRAHAVAYALRAGLL